MLDNKVPESQRYNVLTKTNQYDAKTTIETRKDQDGKGICTLKDPEKGVLICLRFHP